MLKFKFISTEDQEILLEEYGLQVDLVDSIATSEDEDVDQQGLYDFIYELKSKSEIVLVDKPDWVLCVLKSKTYIIIQDNGFHCVIKINK